MKNDKKIQSLSEFIDQITEVNENKINYLKEKLKNDDCHEYRDSLKTEIRENEVYNNYFLKNIKSIKQQDRKEKIEKAKKDNMSGFFFRLFYRGVSNYEYKDVSGIYRTGSKYAEDELRKIIMAECPDEFTDNDVYNLAKLQHYGCPTRLLDVSENPLVALYFACQDNKVKKDGEVRIYAIADRNIKYDDDKIIKILASLMHVRRKDLKNWYLEKDYEKYVNYLKENGIETDSDIEKNLFKSFFYIPPKNNKRIVRQSGAFIINGEFKDQEEAEELLKYFLIEKIRIDQDQKDHILSALFNIGINRQRLFPEIENVVEELKKQFL